MSQPISFPPNNTRSSSPERRGRHGQRSRPRSLYFNSDTLNPDQDRIGDEDPDSDAHTPSAHANTFHQSSFDLTANDSDGRVQVDIFANSAATAVSKTYIGPRGIFSNELRYKHDVVGCGKLAGWHYQGNDLDALRNRSSQIAAELATMDWCSCDTDPESTQVLPECEVYGEDGEINNDPEGFLLKQTIDDLKRPIWRLFREGVGHLERQHRSRDVGPGGYRHSSGVPFWKVSVEDEALGESAYNADGDTSASTSAAGSSPRRHVRGMESTRRSVSRTRAPDLVYGSTPPGAVSPYTTDASDNEDGRVEILEMG